MAFRQALQLAACGLAGGSAAVLFSAVVVGKPRAGGDAEPRVVEPPAWAGAARPGRRLGPQLGQERTTVLGQPAEEEPRAWRRGADIQAGPLQGQGHTAHLPHQALPVPRGRLPGEGPHADAPGS